MARCCGSFIVEGFYLAMNKLPITAWQNGRTEDWKRGRLGAKFGSPRTRLTGPTAGPGAQPVALITSATLGKCPSERPQGVLGGKHRTIARANVTQHL